MKPASSISARFANAIGRASRGGSPEMAAAPGSLIGAILEAEARAPGTPLVVASDGQPSHTTLAEVVAAGRRMGTRLSDAGVAKGDVVAAMLPNWREWLVVAVAAAQSGAGPP